MTRPTAARRAARPAALLALASLLAACADATPGRDVTGPARRADKQEAPAEEYIVSFREDEVSRAEAGPALAATLAGADAEYVAALEYSPAIIVRTADPAALAADPRVRSVVPNRRLRELHQDPVNQTLGRFTVANWQWDMRQIKVLPRLAADGRTTLPVSGAGAKVCIIDSGIDGDHQEFQGKVVAARDFTRRPYGTAVIDSAGHGSHVAGTVTNARRTQYASMAPSAQLLIAKTFGATEVADDAGFWDAYAWCGAQGADAVNMSFGFRGGLPVAGNEAYIAEEQLRLAQLAATGAVITASAGNDNTLIPVTGRIWLPAESPSVLAVGATGPATGVNYPFAAEAPAAVFDARASYSNFGTPVDVYAPGGNAGGTTNPRAILSVCSGGQLGAGRIAPGCGGSTRSYMAIQGTSMAAPHVAGLVALIKSRADFAGPRSDAMRQRITACILNTADPLAAGTPFFGRGRINALRAVTEACPAAPAAAVADDAGG